MSRRRKKPILPTRDERGRFITKSKTKPKAKPQKKKARIPDASSPRVVSDPRRGERHARPVATKVAKAKKGVKKVARKAAPKFTEAQWLAKVNRQIVREQRARARKIAMAVEKKRAADEKADREREVAVSIGHGKSNAEISSELYMSVATVKAHVSRVLTKLELNNRVQIALLAHDAGQA
jgi:DNA-binding CsgD family transcriptional regulator